MYVFAQPTSIVPKSKMIASASQEGMTTVSASVTPVITASKSAVVLPSPTAAVDLEEPNNRRRHPKAEADDAGQV